ncbi:gliding motility-associated C-terminal domain-containing protein [Candidatus Amoebophilus asiaticus]|nr:gliding motility-associated C-terminal domain-containing protein [Candidatus Amoebophilus asiaticus]
MYFSCCSFRFVHLPLSKYHLLFPLTYSWSNGSTTEDLSSIPAGTYCVTITDANGCKDTLCDTVNQPDSLVPAIVGTGEACNTDSTGSADLTVTGGTTPYTYAWSTGATTEDISGLWVDTYTVTVTDANGCVGIDTVAIGEANLTANMAPTDVLCNGDSTGTIDLTMTGGTSPFTYTWSTGDTIEDLTGLWIGSYCVTVTDAFNCTTQACTTVNQPAILSGSIVGTNLTCNSDSSGAMDLTVVGGVSPFTYAWNNGATTEDLTNIPVGTYCVTIADANGCLDTPVCVTITEPSALVVTAGKTDLVCNGDNDGTATATASGGIPPYTYSWNTIPPQPDSAATALTAGPYCVTVSDANGCTVTTCVTLIEPSPISISLIKTDLVCNGDSDGTATASASGSNAPYSYVWNTLPSQTDSAATSLTAGTYCVTVTDVNGCTASACITLNEPTPITFTSSVTNVSCNGGNDGSITVTASGSTPPYVYSWNTAPPQSDSVATALSAGPYCVTITDANGCTATTCITVAEPPALAIAIAKTDVGCNGGDDGTATATASGGTSPFNYVWNTVPPQTDSAATALAIGTYCVTVTDANGCTATACVIISQPSPLTSTITGTNVLCNGDSSGTIDLTPAGGTTVYTYSWSNNETTQDIDTISIGTYCVTITDANGCTTTNCFTITEPSILGAFITSSTDVTCNGGTDGSATVTVFGGTTPYTYFWTPGSQTTPTATGLSAGPYTVQITDSNGCDTIVAVTINEPDTLSLVISTKDANCLSNDGEACVTTSGGTPPYTYSWSTSPVQTDSCATALFSGSYDVTVTDANGCVKIANAIVNDLNAPEITMVSRTHVSCNGSCDGSIAVSVSGGIPPYTYLWTTTTPCCQTDSIATALCADIHQIAVWDSTGCLALKNITIIQPPPLVASMDTTLPQCNGDSNGVLSVTASGGTPPFTYSWSTASSDTFITGLSAGTYTLTLTDAMNCTLIQSTILTEPLLLTLSAGETDATCPSDSDGTVKLTPLGGTKPYTFNWDSGIVADSIATGLTAGTYCATLFDANGCMAGPACATVNDPPPFAITYGTTNATCDSADGTATISSTSGGTPGYTYSWCTSPAFTDTFATGLAAGIYCVTIGDSEGCMSIYNIAISDTGGPVLVMIDSNDVSCNGGCDGNATVSVSLGVSPFTYIWTNGDTTSGGLTSIATGLCAGTYTVEVTDSFGCKTYLSVTIDQPPPITLFNNITDVSCNGLSDGSISVSVSGGTPGYFLAWSTLETTNTITGLVAGTYTITVTDANLCQTTAFYVVTEPDTLLGSINPTNLSCNALCDGIADLTVTGGTPVYTYAWTIGSTTQDVSSLCIGSYTVTITDANSCQTIADITLTEPPVLAATISGTNVGCNGDSTGTANVFASGGTSPYTYNWTTNDTTDSITGLPSGTYTVTISDANGCDTALSIPITEPAVLASIISGTNLSCNNDSTGIADLSVSGGTSPFTYSWSNGETTEDLNNLPTGIYCVTITDVNGCTTTNCVTLTEPSLLGANILNTTEITCNGGSDGTATVTALGGTTTYTYAWSNGETTSTATNLAAGSQLVTVSDANGCDTIVNVTINEPTAVSVSVTTQDATCNNDNGKAIVTPTGGTPGYSYAWNDSLNQTDSIATALASGSYTVTIIDANSCTTLTNVNINDINAPQIFFISLNDASCNGGCDGSATMTAIGGIQPYIFEWNDGQTGQTATGLCAGIYIFSVEDSAGCTRFQNVPIDEPTAISMSSAKIDVSCNGVNDGSISISASGGTPGYNYSWSNLDTGTTVNNLSPNTYIVTVTDANNCILIDSISINEPSVLTIITDSTDVNCPGGNDGIAIATPSGGTLPYTYAWSPGGSTDSMATGLAGTYFVTITDANGCQAVDSTIVIQPSPITVSISVVDNATCDSADGSATVTASGGNGGPYNYVWNTLPPQTQQTATSLFSGIYEVTITDNNNCLAIFGNIIIQDTAGVELTISNSINVSCLGGNDGSVTVSVINGQSPFTYIWSTGDTIVSPDDTITKTGLPAGVVTVCVTDSLNCRSCISDTLIESLLLTISYITTSPSCNGNNDGSISVSASGGTTPYTYNWSTAGSTSAISGLIAGIYTVTVTDALGCDTSVSITLSEPALFTLVTSKTDAVCNGGNDGSAFISAIGGTPFGGTSYIYAWSTNSTDTAASSTITGLTAGTYTVTITDANGCDTIGTFTIFEPSPIVFFSSSTDVNCGGQNTGVGFVSASGGTPISGTDYSYAWTPGTVDTAIFSSVNTLAAGTYFITISDANGCDTSLSITINEPSALAINTGVTSATCGNADGSATATASGGTPGYTYYWYGGGTTQTITNLSVGTYTITVTDSAGCVETAQVLVNNVGGPTLIMIDSNDVSCYGGFDGSATVSAIGLAPFTYIWTNGDTIAAASGLTPGIHSITVQDSLGCGSTDTVRINQPDSIILYTSVTNTICSWILGSATVSASGGTSPYTYNWSTGSSDANIDTLLPGIYCITVSDANGCVTDTCITVLNIDGPIIAITNSSNVSCNGGNDGTATVTVLSGGVTPFTYIWTNSIPDTVDTLANATGLIADIYTIEVKDSNGCPNYASVTITEPPDLILVLSSVGSTCGDSNGSANVNASGGTLPYTYSWSDSLNQNSATATGLLAGDYSVTVTDGNGCVKLDSITITNIDGPKISLISHTDVTCNGGNDGSITVSVFDGTPPYTYTWTPSVSTDSIANSLTAGIYILEVSDSNSCKETLTDTITEPTKVDITLSSPDDSICVGDTIIFTASSSDSIANYEFLDNNVVVQSGPANTYTFIATDSGTVSLSVLATDTAGCISDTSNVVDLTISLNVVADAGPNQTIAAGEGAKLNGRVYNTAQGIWSTLGSGTFIQSVNDLAATYFPSQADLDNGDELNAYVTLILTTVGGCSQDSDTMLLIIQKFNIPNVFTPFPTSPGQNDVFFIHGLPENSSLTVYNRWGVKIFESRNYRNDWDGEGMHADVYYYIIEIGDIKKTGWVRIIRSDY